MLVRQKKIFLLSIYFLYLHITTALIHNYEIQLIKNAGEYSLITQITLVLVIIKANLVENFITNRTDSSIIERQGE